MSRGIAARSRPIRQHRRVFDHRWSAPTLSSPGTLGFPAPQTSTSILTTPYDNFPPPGVLDRNYIFYVGDSVKLGMLSFAPGFVYGTTTVPTGYIVYDFYGNIVTSGAVTGPTSELNPSAAFTQTTISAPIGGFKPGFFRVTWTGPVYNSTYGYTYGTTSFIVIKNTSGFHANVTPNPISDPGTEVRDVVMKASLGIGVSRLQIADVTTVDPAHPTNGGADSLQSCIDGANAMVAYKPSDSARPWQIWCQFRNGSVDLWQLPVDAGGAVYVKDPTVDGSKVFISTGAGTTTGMKLTVAYPNSSTVVETYDNYTSAATLNAAVDALPSAYIKSFLGAVSATPVAPRAIGNGYRNGVIETVQTLFPLGVTHYEGPINEGGVGIIQAHLMRLMTDAVHTGNAAAVAMGPCNVSIQPSTLPSWQAYFTACAAAGFTPDAVSTHMYTSQQNGSITVGRQSYNAWFDLLKRNGMAGKEIWSTESTNVSGNGGIQFNPRYSKITLLSTILLEQYGVPNDRNLVWYDVSHGFWSAPNFIENGDGSLGALAVLYRTRAEELFGKTFHHAVDFGSVQGNTTFLGSVFKGADNTSTVEFLSGSALDGLTAPTVTFTLSGAAPSSITISDALGNVSTVAVSGGRFAAPVNDTPTYIRLPAGANVYVYQCLDWGTNPPPTISPAARGTFSGSTPTTGFTDNAYYSQDTGSPVGVVYSPAATTPDTAEVLFNSTVTADHVLVYSFFPGPVLVDFDVQTSTDNGATWTTRATFNNASVTTINRNPATGSNTGGTWETWWPTQWFYNINLGSTLSFNAVRLNVRQTSYGNAPTLAPYYSGDFGVKNQQIALQQIAIPSSSTPSLFSLDYAAVIEAEASLQAFWRFNDAVLTSGSAAASTINTADVGGSYFGGDFTAIAGPTADNANGAQTTVGSNGFQSASATELGVGDTFTVECWRNAGGFTNDGTFLSWNASTTPIQLRLGPGINPSLQSSSTVIASSAAPIFKDAAWHHYVVTKSGSTTKLYFDGVDVTISGTNVTFSSGGTAQISFASGTSGTIALANLAVYNTALSAADVKAHYYAAKVPSAAPALDATFFAATPAVAGTAVVGGQAQTSQGLWTGAPTAYAYQWQSAPTNTGSWTNISGATRSDYIPVSGDYTKYLRCTVTASNSIGASGGQNSAAFGPVGAAPGAPVNTAAPAASGIPQVGDTLTASTGSWSNTPTAYAYQWQTSADGLTGWTNLSATNSTYILLSGDSTNYMRCQVTATNAAGSASANTNALGPVAAAGLPPSNVTPPAITGTVVVGETLACSTGSWTGSPTSYSYQWQSSPDNSTWTDIMGATANTFVLVEIDDMQYIRCGVIATNQYGSS